MALRRSLFIVSLLALGACGSPLPPAGNYATVSGRIMDARGVGIAGAVVALNGSVLTAVTDERGSFTIAPVPAGDWDYTVSAKGYKTLPVVTNATPLGPGEKRTITLNLARS